MTTANDHRAAAGGAGDADASAGGVAVRSAHGGAHADARSGARVACDHCGLPVPRGLVQDGAEQQFCCSGCKMVYETIHRCGLSAYYRLREDFGDTLDAERRTRAGTGRYTAFDGEAFASAYVQQRGDGSAAIDLMLENVHCAACVWLVERLPRVVAGVIESRLAMREATVRVVFDPQAVKLSVIATALDRLGYPPHPAKGTAAQEVRRRTERRQLVRIGVAGACAGNTMLLAIALYAGVFSGIDPAFERFFRWLSMGIGVVALAWPGATFFRGAWAAVRTRVPNLDVPIALALGVGGVAGVVNVIAGSGEIYFDSLCVLVFLLLSGRFIQQRQQRWADDAVGLMLSLTPVSCRVVRDGGAVVEVPVEALREGDTVEVRSGDLFPADGEVVEGCSTVNRALLTGESEPVAVGPGERVWAGTQNVGSTVRVSVLAVGEATRVGRLMALVARGVRSKPGIVQFADRASGWFVGVLMVLALGVFVGWSVAASVGVAVDHTVALLIVACPCALGLATPLSLAVAVGRAAGRDILIKDAAVLEKLSRPGALLLDKTGTITQGRAGLVAWYGPAWLRSVVAEVERGSTHPAARALVEAFGDLEPEADDRALPAGVQEHGRGGVTATLGRHTLRVGSPRFVQLGEDGGAGGAALPSDLRQRLQEHEARGQTCVLVSLDGEVVALAALGDELHGGAAASVAALSAMRWRPAMLSGDAEQVAQRVAARVGIAAADAHGGLLPEEKLDVVRRHAGGTEGGGQRSGARGTTVMVGDGVNDAAALAAADVGIAVHGGAEASLAAADVYIARPGLRPIVELMMLSRTTMRVIRRNLGVSLAYNTVAVVLAAGGWISPLIAAVLMPVSSITVLALAVGTLGRWRGGVEVEVDAAGGSAGGASGGRGGGSVGGGENGGVPCR